MISSITKVGKERAISELQAAIEQKPELTDLNFALAARYMQSEQPDKAEAEYRKLIDQQGIEPAGLTARVALASLNMQQDNVDCCQITA